MAAHRAVMVALAGVALVMMASRSTLFTQPPAGFQRAERSLRGVGQVESGFASAESLEQPRSSESQAFAGLLCGLVMGLSFAFAGPALAKDAAPAEKAPVVPADFDIRKGQSKEERKLYVADKYAKWNKRKFSKGPDPKFGESVTGAGVYKKFGMDFASPLKGPAMEGSKSDGTYPLSGLPIDTKTGQRYMEKWVKTGRITEGKYGNYYSPSSPYKYNPK